MLFSGLFFLFTFFPLYFIAYYAVPGIKFKNIVLLAFSLLFYAWGEPVYILLLIFSVWINYILTKRCSQDKKRGYAVAAIVFDVAMLAVFKYAGMAVETFNLLPGVALPVPQIRLPLGISFYTFQIISYSADVYRGKAQCQSSFYKLLLYVACFYQLIAGPIVRYSDIAEEIEERRADMSDINAGLLRFITGLGKKTLLANPAGELSALFMEAAELKSITAAGAWLGIIMYSIQIYLDFSAYSDMAIGLGRMVGFHYIENFNYPYIADSITDFWRRWHISLSSFFRDYVYIPLGGNRKRHIFNLLTVWALTGLWHGAQWNFVLWGLYFGIILIAEKYLFIKLRLPAVLKHAGVVLTLLLGWLIFYYNDIGDIAVYICSMFGLNGNAFVSTETMLVYKNNVWFIAAAILACTPVVPALIRLYTKVSERFGAEKVGSKTELGFGIGVRTAKLVYMLAVMLLSAAALVGMSYNPFLYFRF